MISLQDYHILEGKYKDLSKKNIELSESIEKLQEDNDCATKREVRNDINLGDVLDRKNKIIDRLQQELDKYKLITEDDIIHIIKNELDWVSSGTLINIVDVKGIAKVMINKQIYIKEIGKE